MKISEQELNNGVQIIHKFDNGYGASVVRHDFSYGNKKGLWELAVIEFNQENWEITYETPITDDVLGYLTDDEVLEILKRIEAL